VQNVKFGKFMYETFDLIGNSDVSTCEFISVQFMMITYGTPTLLYMDGPHHDKYVKADPDGRVV
jgi:hypothetical protein